MANKTIATVGKLIKKETFRSVLDETHCDKLILENMEPYPGYNDSTVPDNLEADSIFAIFKINYNDERVIRAIQKIKTKSDYKFDAAPGTVRYQNKAYNFVRFKHLPYASVGEVIRQFSDTGIQFRKQNKVAPYESIIEIRKFFNLEGSIKGIFHDLSDKNTFYIQLPFQLSWNNFEKITMNLKYNMDDRNFDAAQTCIYCTEGMMDFVRIYDMESCQGKLLHIQEKYLEAVLNL